MRQTDIKTDDYALISKPIVAVLKCTVKLKLRIFNAAKHLLLKKKQSLYRPGQPRGFQEVKVPRFRDDTGWW